MNHPDAEGGSGTAPSGTITDTDDSMVEALRHEPAALVAPALPMGSLLADRYELLLPLGHGAVSIVYGAVDRRTGEEIAVKVLRSPSRSARARFRREAHLASSLHHPHVLTVFGVFETDDLLFATMPRMRGDLRRRIEDAGLPDFAAAREWTLQIVSAVACAHGASVLHRDVKPANVLLDRTDRAVVSDFGLGKRFSAEADPSDPRTARGARIGTPAYMAPEALRGEALGPPADVYSLGVLAIELLGGVRPRSAHDGRAFAALEARMPAGVRASVDVLRRTLDLRPEGRPADAIALARELVLHP